MSSEFNVSRAEDLIDAILKYADDRGIDTDFIDSIESQIAEKDWVSDAQLAALENIVDSFNIPV
jgi:hypothetical protein